MGYNIGAKGVALALYAITDGDVVKAKEIWNVIQFTDPKDVEEALAIVDSAVKFVVDN